MTVRVQQAAFDLGAEVAGFAQDRTDMGAIVTFTGVVRDATGGLNHMLIEHYPAMTQSAIEKIEAEAVSRWNLGDSLIIHRYGPLAPGDQIMMVATAAPHRSDAFQAAEFLMDYLKSRAPFWKKEVTRDGASWVAAKTDDEDALKRW
ncbi:MAG: molybdenum cofactor biosynthesis protein MoaE [Paracoccaceae bacterium]